MGARLVQLQAAAVAPDTKADPADCVNPEAGISVCQCLASKYEGSEFPWLPQAVDGLRVELVDVPFAMPDGSFTTRCFFYIMKEDDSPELRPVVFLWHGQNTDAGAQYYMTYEAMGSPNSTALKDDRAIVVFPQGTPAPNLLTGDGYDGASFNAGGGMGCCRPAYQLGVDDLGFADLIVQYVLENITADGKSIVDADRLYSTGFSNGCMMTQSLLTQRPNTFAAGACGAGFNPVASLHFPNGLGYQSMRTSLLPESVLPTLNGFPEGYGTDNYTGHYPSLLVAPGASDGLLNTENLQLGGFPFYDDDGTPKAYGNTPNVMDAVSADTNLQIWAFANGCDEVAVSEDERAHYAKVSITKREFSCRAESEITMLSLHGVGHYGTMDYQGIKPGFLRMTIDGAGWLPFVGKLVNETGAVVGFNKRTGNSLPRSPCGPGIEEDPPDTLHGGWACTSTVGEFWQFMKDKKCTGSMCLSATNTV